ncbi:dCTP deaminase [Halonotius sp. GCM10025705]|uniref:dCTP deaminase n=1 Tax=Halonotius sp. GCM10025705 TaxID=3252678 RepID=UPI0036144F61
MPTTDLTAFVDGIVHEPTQTEGQGLDLTVNEIYEITVPGRVDFGGGELESADVEPHASGKRNPDDDYEWWTLDAGQYLIEYNETLSPPEDVFLVVQTRDELLTRGAFHPTRHTQALRRVPLSVGGAGLKLKENARVSTIRRAERP